MVDSVAAALELLDSEEDPKVSVVVASVVAASEEDPSVMDKEYIYVDFKF